MSQRLSTDINSKPVLASLQLLLGVVDLLASLQIRSPTDYRMSVEGLRAWGCPGATLRAFHAPELQRLPKSAGLEGAGADLRATGVHQDLGSRLEETSQVGWSQVLEKKPHNMPTTKRIIGPRSNSQARKRPTTDPLVRRSNCWPPAFILPLNSGASS